jgi:hypothetical protein
MSYNTLVPFSFAELKARSTGRGPGAFARRSRYC